MEPEPRRRSILSRILTGPHGVRVVWRMLMYFGMTIATICILFYFVLHTVPWRIPDYRLGAVLPRELIGVFAALTAAAIMARIERRRFASYGLPWRSGLGARFWEGAVWGFASMTAVLLVLRAAHSFYFGPVELRGRQILLYALGWGVYFLAVGVYEEFTFRGYAQFTLTTSIGFWPAAIVLSGIFGAAHLTNPGENFLGVAQVFLVGMLLCLTLRRTGDLWFAVGVHGAWDWTETFFYGVPDSGLQGPGHFLNPSFHGPAWLTGGSAGPEGSLVTLLIQIGMIGLVMLRFRVSPKALSAP